MTGTRINRWHAPTDAVSLHSLCLKNNWKVWVYWQTGHPFSAGSDPGAESDPDTGVHRSKSLFSQVCPLLFIHEAEGKGEESPPCEAFDVENKISFLICPLMEYTWHILSSYALSASSSVFWLCLLVCVCMHIHAHMVFVISTCVWDKGGLR